MGEYIDPPNGHDIIEKIKSLPTVGDIKNLSDKIFPDWIVLIADEYSTDYQWLTENWKRACEKIGVNRAQIMLVNYTNFEDNHTVLKMFAETFTRSGFNIRSVHDYVICSKCGSVIPNLPLMNIFMEKGLSVPKKWSSKCNVCE